MNFIFFEKEPSPRSVAVAFNVSAIYVSILLPSDTINFEKWSKFSETNYNISPGLNARVCVCLPEKVRCQHHEMKE